MANILSKVWMGILLSIVLSAGSALNADMNLKQMSNEELIQLFADQKWGDNAAWEVRERLEKNNYDQDSELANLLFYHWQKSDNEKIRGWCFQGLRRVKSQKAVDVLISQLLAEGNTRYDRQIAAHYLGEIGNATAVSALESAIRADKGVMGPGRSIARASITALGKIGSPAVPALMKIWNDEELKWDCEEVVVSAMGWTKDMRFGSILVQVLEGKEELIRDNAAWALGEIGDDTLLPKLKKYLNDPNEKVKENVREAINKINQRIQINS